MADADAVAEIGGILGKIPTALTVLSAFSTLYNVFYVMVPQAKIYIELYLNL